MWIEISLGVEEAILEHPLFIYIMVMPKHFWWDLCEFFFLFWENKIKNFFVISIPIFRWKTYKFSFKGKSFLKKLKNAPQDLVWFPKICFSTRERAKVQTTTFMLQSWAFLGSHDDDDDDDASRGAAIHTHTHTHTYVCMYVAKIMISKQTAAWSHLIKS